MDLTQALTPDPPTLKVHPPPWRLTGRGYIVLSRFPNGFLRDRCFLPAELRPSLRGTLAWWMFVDYQSADCGPYQELLFIPGSCAFSGGRFLTISRIFVSSESSVFNGRRNWGIPKERCDFECRPGEDGVERIRLSRDGKVIADLSLRPQGPRFPLLAGLLPSSWLTLGQHRDDHEFIYTPRASGRARLASLLEAKVDPEQFPDLSQGRTLACFAVPEFQMTFPAAKISRIP